jgi:phenylpropionate dioxygenase-like ring-hydroxylating dioxygenase large terminal subunit
MEDQAQMNDDVQTALAGWSSGYALPGAVYRDADLYETEIRRIFLRSWLCVGHQSQIPARGDYFLFEMAGESVIVIRNGEGGINALLNVCRHRGSRICDAGRTDSMARCARRVTCRRASTVRGSGCGGFRRAY